MGVLPGLSLAAALGSAVLFGINATDKRMGWTIWFGISTVWNTTCFLMLVTR